MHRNRIMAGASALALNLAAGLLLAVPASAQTITITPGMSPAPQQALADGETLVVEQGATVSAATAVIDQIDFITFNVDNAGTITGTSRGIDSLSSTLNLINRTSGTIEGGDYGVIASGIEHLTNSGTIQGGDNGVFALSDVESLANTGTITGDVLGVVIHANLESLTNSGTIEGAVAAFVLSVPSRA